MDNGNHEDDPFNEELLLSTICALKNVPLVPSGVKKRKRKPRPPPKRHVYLRKEFLVSPPVHFKEVPVDDPRRKIPHRIVDAFGDGDFEHYASVMRDVCVPELQYFMQYDGKQNPYGPNRREFVGVEEHIKLANATFLSCPDCVTQIYDGPRVYYDETTNDSFASYKVLVSMTKTGLIGPESNKDLEYPVARLPPHIPMVNGYMCAKFTYSMNPQNKMTKYCLLFKYMMTDPSVKHVPGSNIATKADSKRKKTM